MKLKKLFVTAALALGLGVGAIAGISANKNAAEVKADPATYSGSLGIEFQGIGGTFYWDNDNAKVAIKIISSDGKSSGWTDLVATTSGTHRYILNYNLDFNPVGGKLNAYRYSSEASAVSDSSYYNHIENVKFGQILYVYGDYGDGAINSINYYIGADSDSWHGSWGYTLHNAKVEAGNWQVYGDIPLTANDQFKLIHSTNGGDNTYINGFDGPNSVKALFNVPTDNIVCSAADIYRMYYPASGNVWITTVDLAEADEWAEKFNGVLDFCDVGDTDWDTVGTSFAALSETSRGYFNDATANANGTELEKAAARYDFAVTNRGKTPFASGSRAHSSGMVFNGAFGSKYDNLFPAIIVTATVAILGMAGFFFIRKKKHF